jgi:aspartate-semialdehyde dehydrogenase
MDAGAALGEGGLVSEPRLEPGGRTPLAIIGGTGYVGRLLARRLLSHPTFCLGPIVGSSRSEGLLYKEVWEQKEDALVANYGDQLWTRQPFPDALRGVRVSSLDELVANAGCRLAVSCVAPDVGYIEDILTSNGFAVFSISPYKRAHNLMVLEVNPLQMPLSMSHGARLFKSPNCVSVGSTLALQALHAAFGLTDVSVCTLQSLSGRGDALYPPELVQGNVYPIWGTKENTETYIANEISALVPTASLSVRAHRVGVHVGHFIDVRVRVREPVRDVEAVYAAFEGFAPLAHLPEGALPSLPPRPLHTMREVGAPRPASHCGLPTASRPAAARGEWGGMAVSVGNVKLCDGLWHICFSLVVNNMVRGAYGAALLMAEYHQHLAARPAEMATLAARAEEQAAAAVNASGVGPIRLSDAPPSNAPLRPDGVAAAHSKHVTLQVGTPTPTPPRALLVEPAVTPLALARTNAITSREAYQQVAQADPASFHGHVAATRLHWHDSGSGASGAWLSLDEAEGQWTGWDACTGEAVLSHRPSSWRPWTAALDASCFPYHDWFVGSSCSASFNEVDRHVLAGYGESVAALAYGPTASEREADLGRAQHAMTYAELLLRCTVAARALRDLDVGVGDRLVLHLPNGLSQLVWLQAAKRVGAVYACLPTTLSIKALADRIADLGARLVITASTPSPALPGVKVKALALRAVCDYVPAAAVAEAVRAELPTLSEGELSVEDVLGALGHPTAFGWAEANGGCESDGGGCGEGGSDQGGGAERVVEIGELTSRLMTLFSMRSSLRSRAGALAAALAAAAAARHAATSRPHILVLPGECGGSGVASPSGPTPADTPPRVVTPSASAGSALDQLADRPTPGPASGLLQRSASALSLGGVGGVYLPGEQVYEAAEAEVLAAAGASTPAEMLAMGGREMVAALWRSSPPVPMRSDQPMCVMYTSGTAGLTPRGLVYDHAGLLCGAILTMETCLDVRRGSDVLLVRAAPSWVTGQTYAVSGALGCRCVTVLGPWDDLPPATLSAVLVHAGVTSFVASAAVLKRALAPAASARGRSEQASGPADSAANGRVDPLAGPLRSHLGLPARLRVGVSCGEPLSAAAHELGMQTLSPHYINAYWGTEHGAIVLAHTYGNADQPLKADARMRPLPWVGAEVWVAEPAEPATGAAATAFPSCRTARPAPAGDGSRDVRNDVSGVVSGDVCKDMIDNVHRCVAGSVSGEASEDVPETGLLVCTRPWPAMARTVWGRLDTFGSPEWRGELAAFAAAYFPRCLVDGVPARAFSLGDLAQRWRDGSFSVIGRQHELMPDSAPPSLNGTLPPPELRRSSGLAGEASPRVPVSPASRRSHGGAGGRVCVCEVENTLLRRGEVLDCLMVMVPVGADAGDAPRASDARYRRGGRPARAAEGLASAELVPVACLVLRDGGDVGEELAAVLKKMVHEAHGEKCVPTELVPISAIPRTYNSKPMRQVVAQLFAGTFHGDVSEIGNPGCLSELRLTIADWRAMRAMPVLDERP